MMKYNGPNMKQTMSERNSVMVLCGESGHTHYGYCRPAEADLEPAELEHQRYLEDLHRYTAGTS